MKPENVDSLKTLADALSIVTVVGTLIEVLTSVAAIFTILWTGIRIWETETIQRLFGRKDKGDA